MTALSIPSVNLMPAGRVAAARRRQRVRAWIAVLTAYAAAISGIWVYYGYRRAQSGSVTQELVAVSARIENLKTDVKAGEVRLAVAQRELEAAREVRDHPDMSVLLARITGATGPLITLDRLEVRPVAKGDEKGKKSDLAAPNGYTLKLTGLSSDQVDVPRFGQSLQSLGIFESIAVVGIRARETPIRLNSKGDPIKVPQLYAFDIEAVFSDKGAFASHPAGGAK